MTQDKTPQYIKLDERNHVEKPFLDQLDGLGWEIIDLDGKQHPSDSHRQNFTEVMMLKVLRAQLKVINEWLEDDQVEEVVKQLTAGFPGTDLIKNNRHVFTLLLENTSVSENRRTGEKRTKTASVEATIVAISMATPRTESVRSRLMVSRPRLNITTLRSSVPSRDHDRSSSRHRYETCPSSSTVTS